MIAELLLVAQLSQVDQIRHDEELFRIPWNISEFGRASWYGPGFHRRKTSSGERFDQNGRTCAHRTLPFGTVIRVTRLDNHRSITCRVNDRGPFRRGFIVDVSRGGAIGLNLIKRGTAKVRVDVIKRPK